MSTNELQKFLIQQYQRFLSHWQNTHTQGTLTNTLIISISDGFKRAKVITYEFDEEELIKNDGKLILEMLLNKIKWAKKKFDNPLKWLRIEWPIKEKELTWKSFNEELNKYKRNYFRSGIAYRGNTKPWCLLTEMELNANACLYAGADTPVAKVNRKNLETYIKSRHSSKNLPNYDDDMTLLVFQTSGVFFDASTGDVEQLCNLPRRHGHRQIDQLNGDITADLIGKTTTYLANQVLEGGQFEYGHFPCFGRTINFYNTLRHASSIYAMIEGYEFCRNNTNSGHNEDQLKNIANNIDAALNYMFDKIIKFYSGDKAYVLEENGEIKLGANAVAILALTKYYQVFDKSNKREDYLATAEKLANGILAMQKDNGQFVHILDSETLDVIAESRVIYYDGEAAFGLMRLYGITQDNKWIDCVTKAFDYFISAGHNGAHDHWLSYCSNELVIYKPEKKYFQFAVNNVKGYTNFIKNRITTFPTLLELSMAFHKMLLKLDEHPEHLDVLEGFDVNDFYEALHARANYLINGFFFPEMAMFYKKPNTILHGCFIRHHAFRVRIDDVEHYLSGWVAYHDLISKGVYPKTAKQVDRSLVDGYKILTPSGLTTATGGRWLVKPSNQWSATGLCLHPAGFKEGCLLVARGKSMQRGFLPRVAVKSFTLKGAGAIITDSEEDYLDFGIPVLLVNNVRQATLDIGRWARKYFQGDVIGVTGSAGKTTTVAMLAHALKLEGEVGQTKGSANLPIGIAWNMSSISQSAKSWVLEMAIGNMALNSQMVQPDIAIITNIAAAHLEYHNTLDMVAIKKSRIFEGMKPGNLAVICRDIDQYDLIVKKAKAHDLNVISYGEHNDSDIKLVSYQYGSTIVNIKGENFTINLASIGKHMVLNAMAVLAVADYKGLDIDKIIDQMKTFKAVEGRGEVFKTQFEDNQVTIYDEAYNANPLSMKAALEAFEDLAVESHKKVVILGDMLELGDNSEKYHLDLKDDINAVNCREIIFIGNQIKPLFEFLNHNNNKIYHIENVDGLKPLLSKILRQNDHILIKASHSIGLGQVFSKDLTCDDDIDHINEFTKQAGFIVKKFKLLNGEIKQPNTLISIRSQVRKVPASLAKLMTVMVVWDKIREDDIDYFQASTKVPIELLPGSSETYKLFEKNELVSLNELIKATLIVSSNESAYSLAIWHSGNEQKFVEVMNEKSNQLGLDNTYWASSSGLSNKAYSTAEDMLKIAEVFISDYTPISKYCAAKNYRYKTKILKNTNRLIHKYETIQGLKTGNIVGIGSSLINYWSDKSNDYLSVVLCAENRKACFELSEWAIHRYSKFQEQENSTNDPFVNKTVNASVLVAEFNKKNSETHRSKILKTFKERQIQPSIGLAKLMTVMLIVDKANDLGININEKKIDNHLNSKSMSSNYLFSKDDEIVIIELIKAILVAGSNEAALILAEWHSGDEISFIKKMNQKSSEYGMNDTYWTSCTGLNTEAYTTVNDTLILIENFLIHYNDISYICSEKKYRHQDQLINNRHSLLLKYKIVKGINYSNFSGIGSNLINYWDHNDKSYISIVLGASNRRICLELSEWIMLNLNENSFLK